MAKARNIEGLDCDGNAGEGIRLVLSTRFHEMAGYAADLGKTTDPDVVHDMRVASRRLRSALRDFWPYLRRRRLRQSVKAIKEVADALGTVRDHDVAILILEGFSKTAPGDVVLGVRRLIVERGLERSVASERLVKVIERAQLDRLGTEFDNRLENSTKSSSLRQGTGGGTTVTSFLKLGNEVIARGVAEFQDRGREVFNPFNQDRLHRLRIAARHLRYSHELYSQCHGEALKELARELANLQGSLGDLRDCDLWVERLSKSLRSTMKVAHHSNDATTDGPVADGTAAELWLLSKFTSRRTRYYRDSLTQWQRLNAEAFRV